VRRCDQKVDNCVTYSNSVSAATDWIHTVHDQLAATSDVTGDVLSVTARLQHVNELAGLMPEGHALVEACVRAAAMVSEDFDISDQHSLLDGVVVMRTMWQQLQADLIASQQSLSDTVQRWNDFEEQYHTLDKWLLNVEESVKRKISISDMDEIEPLVKSYEVSTVYSTFDLLPMTESGSKL